MTPHLAAATPNVVLLNMTAIIAILGALIIIVLLFTLISHGGTLHRGETATLVKVGVGILAVLVMWAAITNGPQAIGSTLLHALFKI